MIRKHFENIRRLVIGSKMNHRAESPGDTTQRQAAELAVKQALIEKQSAELQRLQAELAEAVDQVTGLTEALHGTQAENDRLAAELERAYQETAFLRQEAEARNEQIKELMKNAAALRSERSQDEQPPTA